MNPIEYISSLLPNFRRDTLLSEMENLASETSEKALAPFINAAELYGGRSLANIHAQAIAKRLNESDRRWNSTNYLPQLAQILREVPAKIQVLGTFTAAFGRDVTAESLNYQRMSILRYLEVIRFVVEYSRELLVWTIHAESLAVQGKQNAEPKMGSQAEAKEFERDMTAFIRCINLMWIPADQVERALKAIPDVMVRQDHDEVLSSTLSGKLDPLRLNFIAPAWNPVFHIRMDLAQMGVRRYQLRTEQIRLAEYKLMELRQRMSGNPSDPKLQKAIDVYTNEVSKLRFKNKQFEEKYNIGGN